jgi:hypothetical protein
MSITARKFSYYSKLNAFQKGIYDRSDSIQSVDLPSAERFTLVVKSLKSHLEAGNLAATQAEAQNLMTWLCRSLNVPSVHVKVLETRPSRRWGELHGLYTAHDGRSPVVTVWMRTAKRSDVVAFRSFLRTMIHELIHHLDYNLFKFADSFHTAGFFKRESSLVNALLGENAPA